MMSFLPWIFASNLNKYIKSWEWHFSIVHNCVKWSTMCCEGFEEVRNPSKCLQYFISFHWLFFLKFPVHLTAISSPFSRANLFYHFLAAEVMNFKAAKRKFIFAGFNRNFVDVVGGGEKFGVLWIQIYLETLQVLAVVAHTRSCILRVRVCPCLYEFL